MVTSGGVTTIPVETFDFGTRGVLTVIGNAGFGFPVARAFWIYSVAPGARRGGHAHRETTQVLVMLRGRVDVELHGHGWNLSFVLTDSKCGALVVPPLTWLDLFGFSPDALLLVLASTPYSEADYIRDRAEFDRLIAARSEGVA